MTASEENPRIGSRFGHYELKSLCGRGGMGEVYAAYDTVKDRTVALKLLPERLAADPVYQERFRRESQAAARLQEPHIIPIHDWGELDGTLFIDMRLVNGRDLRAVLDSGGALPPQRAVALISQVASALDAAHQDGLVHRDVKPENILVTADDFVYLVDFGIATSAVDSKMTTVGSAVGSYSYMAPERFGDAPVTPGADTYSLACVLYECLTGTKPYRSGDMVALIAAHVSAPAPRPSGTAGVPIALDAVIAAGLAKTPAGRPATAGEFARAARAALSDSPDTRVGSTTVAAGATADTGPTQLRQPIPYPVTGEQDVTVLRASAAGDQTVLRTTQAAGMPGPQGYPLPYQFQQPGYGHQPAGARQAGAAKVLAAVAFAVACLVTVGIAGWLVTAKDGEPSSPAASPTIETVSYPSRDSLPYTTVAPTVANAAPISPPPHARFCPPNHGPGGGYSQSYAGSDMTTCPFAEEVRRAYAGSGAPGQTRIIAAHSPVTKVVYPMTCTVDRGLVMCTGGDNAVVYLT